MSEQKLVVFNLSEPLEYSKSGNKEETLQIEMFAPTYSTAKFTYKLSQYFIKAIRSGERGESSEEDQEKAEKEMLKKQKLGEEIMSLRELKVVMFGADTPFEKVLDTFIFNANKVCFVDSEKKVPLTSTLIGKFSFDDMTDLVCVYMVNFIVPFALSMK